MSNKDAVARFRERHPERWKELQWNYVETHREKLREYQRNYKRAKRARLKQEKETET